MAINYSVFEHKLGNKTRVRLLLLEGVPVYWPSLFVVETMRARSVNTQQSFLSNLLAFFKWLEIKQIDLESRLSERPSSKYLTENELMDFMNHAHWTKSTLDNLANDISMHPTAFRQIGAAQAESRINSIKRYLSYLYENLGDERSKFAQIDRMKKRLNLGVREIKPAWKKRKNITNGLSQNQVDIILCRLHFNSADNPWPKSEAIRVRNYMIFFLLFELGIRRSELLGIKLEDINWRANQLQIIRRHNDPDDQRKVEPLVKTNERILPVPDHLMTLILLYKENFRISKTSKKHPYLLVSHGRGDGSPLSIKALDQIFVRIRTIIPELKGVTPHSFRHHDVYKTIQAIERSTEGKPVEERMERERRILLSKYGWSDSSKMPDLYGQRYYQEEADDAIRKRSKELADGSIRESRKSKNNTNKTNG